MGGCGKQFRRLALVFAVSLAGANQVALAADHVAMGTLFSGADAPFFIADARGYFKDVGIEMSIDGFHSAGKMIVPLSSGDLDVASGSTSAGLYNAASRAINIRIVADKGRMAPGFEYQRLVIRRALIESGAFKTYADLKGKKIALAAPAISTASLLNEAARKGGLTFNDIDEIYLGFPAQIAAFANGAIDGATMVEPYGTAAIASGGALSFASSEDFYPSDQISVVFYSEAFAKKRPDVAARFMTAYVRGVRDYLDVVEGGRYATGPKADAVVSIVSKGLGIKPEDLRAAYVHAVDPDGRPNVASLEKDLAFFKAHGDVTNASVQVNQLLDLSFVDAAVKQLGPYTLKR